MEMERGDEGREGRRDRQTDRGGRDQEVHLALERLMPGGGGPYLHVFSNYSLPKTTVWC